MKKIVGLCERKCVGWINVGFVLSLLDVTREAIQLNVPPDLDCKSRFNSMVVCFRRHVSIIIFRFDKNIHYRLVHLYTIFGIWMHALHMRSSNLNAKQLSNLLIRIFTLCPIGFVKSWSFLYFRIWFTMVRKNQ